ncbi:lipopolysaccharide biosynthesis protein [Pseudohoeflea sp. DP4N28-3]|uniref:Lipopolysaccharide biosynthesis protein n=2 Tax=Pseudohoeflea coraliihabitans TaxID=2860393 RepID=A0ABS6WN11_9HYPH|nr:lipopolysaccharide biosynthesis protein [Pseudohoeflea sp. DP4N28-3]
MLVAQNRQLVGAYLSMTGGSAGRLVISLAYFIAVANTLSIGDFGLFATASACGIMLSRLLAFGFVSPLYRIATVRKRLLGAYTAGFIGGALLSLPAIALASGLTFMLVFSGDLALAPFVRILAAEILFWRVMEIVVIVTYGLNRFAAGSALVVIGTALKAIVAVAFAWSGATSLETWSWFYVAATAAAAVTAIVFFYPRVRLRWVPRLYIRRWVDAVSVAGAEMLFYVQSELDKILVLGLGGPETAGIYAMIMRLVDLTALPVRSFLTILVQKLMRAPQLLDRLPLRIGFEALVAVVSTAGLLAMALVLALFPMALGANVAEAAPLLILVLSVPALRNLLEYHSELLYGTGRTVIRAIVLASLAATKALLLTLVLTQGYSEAQWVPLVNAVFVALYLQSALMTYRALKARKRRVI